jgi:hypothetical protein
MAKGLTGRKDMLRFLVIFPFSAVIPSGYYWWKNEKMGRIPKKPNCPLKERKTIEGKICKGKANYTKIIEAGL